MMAGIVMAQFFYRYFPDFCNILNLSGQEKK